MIEAEPVDWSIFSTPCGGRVEDPQIFVCPLNFALLNDIEYVLFISSELSNLSSVVKPKNNLQISKLPLEIEK